MKPIKSNNDRVIPNDGRDNKRKKTDEQPPQTLSDGSEYFNSDGEKEPESSLFGAGQNSSLGNQVDAAAELPQ